MFCRVAAPFHVHTSIAAGLQLLHNPAPRALFPGGLKAAVPVAVKQHLPGGFICIFLKPKGEGLLVFVDPLDVSFGEMSVQVLCPCLIEGFLVGVLSIP